ncbi:MAG: putative cobyric acid synthase [Nitrosopumilales archaeon]|nr:MAG: putative cobyric acid synthase [Nitrosopumilales archaeon]
MIQGTSSGAGKTTLVAALCRIFSNAGYNVAPFKSQNMSNFSYKGKGFEISRAQAVQAVAARTEITPDMNPILLKPRGDYWSSVFLKGKYYKKLHANEYYKKFVLSKGLELVSKSLHTLQKNYDLVILEGAGSPAEINLEKFDIANMGIAKKTSIPVILITDIDRGGSFASIVGTLQLLDKKYQKLVKGFVFNKFRGDLNLLKPGFHKIKQITGKPVFGTIPMAKFSLPEEDSLGVKPKEMAWNKKNLKNIDSEIEKLSKLVKLNLNIKAIERLFK